VLGVQYFPAIHWKRRLALESPLKKALGKRFLMIRPPAVEIISHLRAFADDSRYDTLRYGPALSCLEG
jgi:hypothetical protein